MSDIRKHYFIIVIDYDVVWLIRLKTAWWCSVLCSPIVTTLHSESRFRSGSKICQTPTKSSSDGCLYRWQVDPIDMKHKNNLLKMIFHYNSNFPRFYDCFVGIVVEHVGLPRSRLRGWWHRQAAAQRGKEVLQNWQVMAEDHAQSSRNSRLIIIN